MRRGILASALAALTIAGVGAVVLPAGTAGWAPVTYGLSAGPHELLPAVVSPARPARVVSTTLDEDGRPVVTVREATDRDGAAGLVREAQRSENAVGVEVDAVVEAFDAPTGSDPQRAQQWDLGTIGVPAAWQRSTGAGVTVAVIDTGVQDTHPDLAGQVLPGYNAITDTPGGTDDENGHGTHVAGTIAALTGNGTGVASIAPNARILPVRVLGADGLGWTSDFAEGIIWAADHGAQVINLSLGSAYQTGAVSNAVSYARSRNVVVVAAAGNYRAQGSPVSYPGADAGVIGVAATDSADRYASYSNAGSYVDIAAPGSNILSTVPTNGYAYYYGTSMASPHVAAVAALILAERPELTPDQVENALTGSAVDLGTPGRDDDYGYGRLDAPAALAAATALPTAPATTTPATTAPTTPETTAPPTPPTTDPAPEPTTTPVPAEPVIRANVTARQVHYGSATRTTFTITAGGTSWAGMPVTACTSAGAAAWSCTSARTSSTGTYTYSRTATGAFRVRVNVPATDTNTAAAAAASYTVRATVTATRTAKGTLTVRVNGATRQKMSVQRYAGGKWRTVKTYATVSSRRVTGLAPGGRYRVVVAGTSIVLGATSATVSA